MHVAIVWWLYFVRVLEMFGLFYNQNHVYSLPCGAVALVDLKV